MRRHKVCIHNPPCCYITDGGTDSSATECCLPRCRNHPKKKPYSVNVSRSTKRRDVQSGSKHCSGSHYSNLKCNRRTQYLNYENRYLKHDQKKTRFKMGKTHEELSGYDVGSLSSQCTSLSVDVSKEMAAVNRDIETILAHYEKTLDEKSIDKTVSRHRMSDKYEKHKQKKENLTLDQVKLLSMDKPPIDKLKDLPYEYIENLKPRPPPSHKENVFGVNKSVKKGLKESFEAYMQREQVADNQRTELLEGMWKDVIEKGLAKEDLNSNVKPIYTSMTLDENASININFGKPPSHQEPQLKKGNSVGTAISPRVNYNPSVATQTTGDYDAIINRIKTSSCILSNSCKKHEEIKKKTLSNKFFDRNMQSGISDLDIGDSEKKNVKILNTPPHLPKPSGDATVSTDQKEKLTNFYESKYISEIKSKFPSIFTTSPSKEFNIYSFSSPETMNILKKSDYYCNKTSHLNSLLSKKLNDLTINEKMLSISDKINSEFQNTGTGSPNHLLQQERLKQELGKHFKDGSIENNAKFCDDSSTEKITMFPNEKNLKDGSDSSNSTNKFVGHITDNENKLMLSFLQKINPALKCLKENSKTGLDTPLCVEIIKRLTDTMMKYEPGKLSSELTSRSCYICMDELRKSRAKHLRHIQNEVKHIEELDKFLDTIGIGVQLLYKTTNMENSNQKSSE